MLLLVQALYDGAYIMHLNLLNKHILYTSPVLFLSENLLYVRIHKVGGVSSWWFYEYYMHMGRHFVLTLENLWFDDWGAE